MTCAICISASTRSAGTLAIRAERSASMRSNATNSSTDGLRGRASGIAADLNRPESVLLCTGRIDTPACGGGCKTIDFQGFRRIKRAIFDRADSVGHPTLLRCSGETIKFGRTQSQVFVVLPSQLDRVHRHLRRLPRQKTIVM